VLLLFDIDGTLLAGAAEAHRQALYAALHAVHGVDGPMVGGVLAPAGRTDGEIARAILLDAGVSAERIDARAASVREVACQEYAERCPEDLSSTVIPGIRELLEWCSAREDMLLGLVTGNFEAIARLKLARAGIGGHFRPGLGGFGSDAEDRAALPHLARRRAGHDGVPFPRAQTVVIGDTPRDIACARADGVRCIAVATGPYDVEQLGGADGVAADAGALRQLLSNVLPHG
jgi:phosphoglycolate phosphatase